MPFRDSAAWLKFEHTLESENVVLRLLRRSALGATEIPTADWVSSLPQLGGPLSMLFGEAESSNGGQRQDVTIEQNKVRLSPKFVAALTSMDASALGLPPPTQFALDLKSRGLIPDKDFRIESRWIAPGGSPVRGTVQGSFIESTGGRRRIPEPLYSIWCAAQRLTQPLPETDRFAAIADLQNAIPPDARVPVVSNDYLADTRIHYASCVSLSLARSDAFDFDPVLFNEKSRIDADEQNRPVDEEDDRLLSPAAQKLFSGDRFRR